jgi:hypothetical protein
MKFVCQSIALLACFATAAPSFAAPKPWIEHREIKIDATAPPTPALKYRLMPEYAELVPGNAAPRYLLAFELLPTSDHLQDFEDEAQPLDQEAVRKELTGFNTALEMCRIASLREQCIWDLPIRQQGFQTLLPHLSRFRLAARALSLRARVETANGQYDQAIATLRIGFAMAQHLRDQATLVQALAATGIESLLLERIADIQKSAGAPNLYWTLANLPHPLIVSRTPIQIEQAMATINFPELRDRPIEQLDPDELRTVLRKMWAISSDHQLFPAHAPAAEDELDFAVSMVSAYEAAKRQLIQQGRSLQDVQKLPIESVLVPYLVNDYLQWSDEVYKWAGLPYWQGHEGMSRAIAQLQSQPAQQINPLMKLIPGIRAFAQFARWERQAAWMQTVESLRAYAASHDHKLPASLDDLRDTPAPPDPMTGKPFGYELHSNAATLRAPAISDHAPETIVQITLR